MYNFSVIAEKCNCLNVFPFFDKQYENTIEKERVVNMIRKNVTQI